MKKLFIIIFTIFMLLTANAAFAEGTSGTLGETAAWSLSEDGTLTVSGSGAAGDGVLQKGRNFANYVAPKESAFGSWDSQNIKYPIKHIIIEEGITELNSFVFYGCRDVESVTLPESLKKIGSEAFAKCTALRHIEFTGGLKEIAKDSFKESGISQVTFSKGFSAPVGKALGALTELEKINIHPDNQKYTFKDECLYSKDLTTLYYYPNNKKSGVITLPDHITHIGDCVFENAVIDTINLPGSLQSVGDYAFSFSKINNVKINSKLKSIGESAFEYNLWLTAIDLSEVTRLGKSAFAHCHNLKNVTMPLNIERVEARTFENCRALESIKINEGTKIIDEYAFYSCRTMKEALLPQTLKEIGYYSFAGCSALQNLKLPSGLKTIQGVAFDGCESLTDIVLPEGLEAIAGNAFQFCRNIQKIIIPESVTKIGKMLFAECDSLETIVFCGQAPDLTINDPKDRIFDDRYSLTIYYNPNSGWEKGKEFYPAANWVEGIPDDMLFPEVPEEVFIEKWGDKQIAAIPACKVTLNGQDVDSTYRQFPLLQFKNIVYFPMTYYDCRYLGLTTKWDSEAQKLTITKENITASLHPQNWQWENGKTHEVQICRFGIEVNGKRVMNVDEPYPLITFRDVTYFPITWRFAVDEFGWDYTYTQEDGLVITSKNYHSKTLNLPDAIENGTKYAATDGEYYYYLGNGGVIYRTPVNDISKNEVVHETGINYTTGKPPAVSFVEEDGVVYMSYHLGSNLMGTDYRYAINKDGTVSGGALQKRNSTDKFNRHDLVSGDKTITWANWGTSCTGELSYTGSDGIEHFVTLDGVFFGEARVNGSDWWCEMPQVSGNIMYVTGVSKNEEEDSKLYRVDMETGSITKLQDDVGKFRLCKIYSEKAGREIEVIYFWRNGKILRYDCETEELLTVDETPDSIVSLSHKGGLVIAYGRRVYYYDAYGENGSKKILYEPDSDYSLIYQNGASISGQPRQYLSLIVDRNLIVSDSNIRLAVFNDIENPFFSADIPRYGETFIFGDTLLYTTTDTNQIIEVDLGQFK